MKKSLLALAVLGAFAGAASAQSSVTLFGVVDLSANYVKNGTTTTKTLESNQLNSNRLGFRGVEDLGGGLKAGFWLEAGMDNADGVVGAANGNVQSAEGAASSQLFNRRSTVSLMGNFGEVRLGRDYDPTFWNIGYFDVYGANGYGQGLNILSTLGSGATTQVRANNAVAYFLPGNLGGLYGQATAAGGESTAGNKYAGGRIGWASGPFDVAVAYSETNTAVSDKFKVFNVGGSWDFGVVKVFGLYDQNKFGDAKSSLYELSLSAPFGQSELRAGYGHSKTEGVNGLGVNVASHGDGTANSLSVEYIYNLSKRTALYAQAAQISNGADTGYRITTAAGTATDDKSRGVGFGLRHSF